MIFKYLFPEFLFSGLGLGGGGGGSTTTQEIPEELKPLAEKYTDKATDLADQKWTPYGEQRYAGFNPFQTEGFRTVMNRAQGGSATMNNAEGALNRMIDGGGGSPYAAQFSDMADGGNNPYLDAMVSKAQESVKTGFNTAAVNSGSFGNSGLQEQFQQGLGDVATQIYGGAYDADQNRRLQAMSMGQDAYESAQNRKLSAIDRAPTFANQAYTDAQQMMNVGQIRQDQAQQGKDFQFSQYQDKMNLPYKQLAAMSGVFGSGLGGTSTTTGGGK